MMAAPMTYEAVGPELIERGFAPVPIRRGTKAPCPDHWQHGDPGNWHRRFKREWVGLLTATTPAIDIDVRHEPAAIAIDRLAVEYLGDAPLRIGVPPKRLRVYRADQGLTKLKTAGFCFPDDPAGAKPHAIEILADGQQFVAFAIHPDTGLPYAWLDDSPLDLEWQDLPLLDPAAVPGFLAEAEALLRRHGAVRMQRAGGSTKARADRLPGPVPRSIRSLSEAERVLAALGCIDPSQLDYDDWIRVGYGIKAALGEPGRGVWLAWCAEPHGVLNPKNDPDYSLKSWNGIRPELCGWKYVERVMASLTGAAP